MHDKVTDKRKFDIYKSLTCIEDYDEMIRNLEKETAEVKEMAAILNEELTRGKSFDYSQEYARLRVICKKEERIARSMADMFERYVNMGMDLEFARKQSMKI